MKIDKDLTLSIDYLFDLCAEAVATMVLMQLEEGKKSKKEIWNDADTIAMVAAIAHARVTGNTGTSISGEESMDLFMDVKAEIGKRAEKWLSSVGTLS